MSKAYLQPFLIFPDAVLGSMLVTLAGETDATPVYDPNTGSILSQPLGINSVGEVTPFHANDNVLYDLHVFAAGVSAVVGNQLYTRENVTVVGGISGAVGPAGPAGPTGPKGDKGDAGATGETGATGAAGTNGTNGTNGINGADGIAGYIQLPALPVDPSTVPIGQPVILPDGTLWTNVTGSWTTVAVSEAMLDAVLAELIPVDAVTDGSTKAVTSNAVFDALAVKANEPTLYTNRLDGDSNSTVRVCEWQLSKTAYIGGAFTLRIYQYDILGSFGYCDVMFRYSVTGSESSGSWLFEYVGGSTSMIPWIRMRYTADASRWYFAINCHSTNLRILSQMLKEFNSEGTYIVTMGFRDIADSGGTTALTLAITPPAGDNSTKVANTEFVGKPSGSVIMLSSSQTITPTNGAVYYVSGSYNITLSNSSALGTRCYIKRNQTTCELLSVIYTDVAGNASTVQSVGANAFMCERFADGWMVI